MITVHHLENSRSQRVLWLLEELELPSVHPLGKSPVVSDGDLTIAETGAIVEYLVDKAGGRLRPQPGTAEHRRYTYWLHFAEGSAMPPLVMALVFRRIKSTRMPFFAKPIARAIADKVLGSFVMPNIERQLDFMESELATRAWFAGGEFSAADVMMSFPLEAASTRAGLQARCPKLAAWLARIHERPAYRRALERGGPFTLLG
jgi:glutathione S-transferase